MFDKMCATNLLFHGLKYNRLSKDSQMQYVFTVAKSN